MAPPSRRVRTNKPQQQKLTTNSLKIGRVTKACLSNSTYVKPTQKQKAAFENVLVEKEDRSTGIEKLDGNKTRDSTYASPKRIVKRKRDEIQSDESDEQEDSITVVGEVASVKKAKLRGQLPSPPASQCNTDTEASVSPSRRILGVAKKLEILASPVKSDAELSEPLQQLVLLHRSFLRALSLHYAHHGASTPAESTSLLASITRIWKKSSVSKEMVQRMLALYELENDLFVPAPKLVEHKNGPFKLVISGLGAAARTNIEFVGIRATTTFFEESKMQLEYERIARSVFDRSYRGESSFVHRSLTDFPQLAILLGTQTQARQEKASATRNELLRLANVAQSRSLPNLAGLSIDSSHSDQMSTPASTKSRTLSLFDRVRAKGLASSSISAPTTEQILRRHAIGRIAEVVEFLRMKQQQKAGSQFTSTENDSSDTVVRGKISFSLNSIVSEIQQSVTIPLGAEEARCCIKLISQEVPQWMTCLDVGSVQSVTLIGGGVSGIQVRQLLEAKEKKS